MGYENICQNQKVKEFLEATKVRKELLREMMAEFLGVFILCMFGNGAIAQHVLSRGQRGDFISINWGYGIGVAMGCYVAGNVSGAHLNPAISVAFSVMGRLKWSKLPFYILAQLFGGFMSGAVLYAVYYDAIDDFDELRTVMGENATAGIFATYPQAFLSISNGFVDQMVATALLSALIIAITTDNRVTDGLTPLLVGLIVFVIGISYGHNCGYAINPARDLGPRLFTATVGYGAEVFSAPDGRYFFWVPIAGPTVGAVLGVAVYKLLVGHHIPVDDGRDEVETRSLDDDTSAEAIQEKTSSV